jgi:ABC-type uncharacterized transport system substrate-binding protein
VRRYLHGLVGGLNRRGYRFGEGAADNEFVIDFRLTDPPGLASPNTFRDIDGVNPHVIFCMSTSVARAAGSHSLGVPIVGVVSEPLTEGLNQDPYCGVSAQRIQKAGDCYKNFRLAVPSLTKIFVLGNSTNSVSNRARDNVIAAALADGNFPIEQIDVTDIASLDQNLTNRLVKRTDLTQPCRDGVLVLPLDMFLSRANRIIAVAQDGKHLPAFFPVPDFVRGNASSAVGAYGVPQRRCGVLMAEQVHYIFTHNGQPPAGHNGQPPGVQDRWLVAPEYDFEFSTSAPAAEKHGITLGPHIPPPEE